MGRLSLTLALFAVSAGAFAAVERPFLEQCRGRTPLVVNGDNDHYFKQRPFRNFLPVGERWTKEGMRRYIDVIAAGGKVTHFFACAVGQRASYDSKVCDPIWLGVEEARQRGEEPDEWPLNAKRMHDAGLDCFSEWCEYGRTKGLSVWISQRMNDIHFGDRYTEDRRHFRNNRFWSAHPELHRNPAGRGWADHAFDYTREAVREFEFAIFRELVDRYDADGFELDFMRFTDHLTPGREWEQSGVLTDFIARCRAYANDKAKERGHTILLSTRVPSDYAAARARGYDPEEWARRGLVDLIVVTDFYAAAVYDFDLAGWNARIEQANPAVVVLPGLNDNAGCRPGFQRSLGLADLCGWADNARTSGAAGFYLFNAAYLGDESQLQIYRRGFAPDEIRSRPRTYVASYHDVSYPGLDNGCQFPVDLGKGGEVRVRVGSRPSGEVVYVVLGGDAELAQPECRLNGTIPSCVRKVDEPDRIAKRLKFAWTLTFPASALQIGVNRISLAAQKDGGRIMWAEIRVADDFVLKLGDNLDRLLEEVRQVHVPGERMTIHVHPGTYPVATALKLDARDSGLTFLAECEGEAV